MMKGKSERGACQLLSTPSPGLCSGHALRDLVHPPPLLLTLEDIRAEGIPCVHPLQFLPITRLIPGGFQGLERDHESLLSI